MLMVLAFRVKIKACAMVRVIIYGMVARAMAHAAIN